MDPSRLIFENNSTTYERSLSHSHSERGKDLKQYIEDGGDLNVKVSYI